MKEIDWEQVNDMLSHDDENIIAISEYFGVSLSEFLAAMKKEYNLNFKEYLHHIGLKEKKEPLYKRKINWDMVRKRFIQGCYQSDVAREVGYKSSESLDLRCRREMGMSLNEFHAMSKSKGDNALHATQFKKGLEGDNTMLLWLGKNRLKQSEKVEITDEREEKLDDFLNYLKQLSPDAFENGK